MALLGRLGRRHLPVVLVLGAFASVGVTRPAPAGAAPATQPPQGYVLVDAGSGCQLAAKNEHQPFLTASTAKLLTAVTALERLPLDSMVPVSALAAGQEESKINMKEGQVWKLDDALHSLLIVSANDAAFAIAERAGGSIPQFAKDANATAKELGAENTTFGDPAGLDDRTSYAGGTHMSPYDLAVVARNALAIPEIANTTKLLTYDFTDPTGTVRHLTNHNKGFLTTYPGAIGMKTGYTKAANRTLVTAATRNGRTMIAVVMGTWDDTGWAGYLLDQGFSSAPAACSVKLPPVRAVTADTRREVFEGLPPVLGTPALDGGAAATVAGATTLTPSTTKAAKHAAAASSKRHDGTTSTTRTRAQILDAQAAAATRSSDGGAGFTLGTVFDLKIVVVVTVLVLLALFLLRRRAVRRQRARRIRRQKQLAEARRRRMIDVVEPGEPDGHVRVVPPHPRSTV